MLKIHTATAGVLAGALLLTGCSSSVRDPKPVPSTSSSTSVSANPSVSATPSSSPSASATPSESATPTVTPSPVPTTEAPVQAPATEAPSAEAPAAPVSEAPAQQAEPVQQAPVATEAPVQQAPAQAPAAEAPAQQAPAQPVQQAPARSSVYYETCADARAAGAAPLHRGEPGYRPGLDKDGDGVACEPKKKHSASTPRYDEAPSYYLNCAPKLGRIKY